MKGILGPGLVSSHYVKQPILYNTQADNRKNNYKIFRSHFPRHCLTCVDFVQIENQANAIYWF
jgi:hypothetical protein